MKRRKKEEKVAITTIVYPYLFISLKKKKKKGKERGVDAHFDSRYSARRGVFVLLAGGRGKGKKRKGGGEP